MSILEKAKGICNDVADYAVETYNEAVDYTAREIMPNSLTLKLYENSDDAMHALLDTYPLDGDVFREDVNREVTNRVYREDGVDPLEPSKNPLLYVPDLALSSLRRSFRWFMPQTMEAAVTKGNPEIEAQVLMETLKKE